MAPRKFASVRYKSRPTARLTAFRDDSGLSKGLIALRYEETKQAEPPIPLPPPRNPRRAGRPHSTLTTASTATSPIIIPPPIAPPPDQHPLFRQPNPSWPEADDRKRDSGLATTSPSTTIREEEDEDVVDKIGDDFIHVPGLRDDKYFRSPSPTRTASTPASLKPVSRIPRPQTLETSVEPSACASPGRRPVSISRRLGKTFSIGSAGTKGLRRNSLGKDRATMTDACPAMAWAPADSSQSPRPPSGTEQQHWAKLLLTQEADYLPITTHIPGDAFWDEFNKMSFSNRGSVMFGGKRALSGNCSLRASVKAESVATTMVDEETDIPHTTPAPAPASLAAVEDQPLPAADSEPEHEPEPIMGRTSDVTQHREAEQCHSTKPIPKLPPVPSIRVLPIDVERESLKVRSLYENGDGLDWEDGRPTSSFGEPLEPTAEVTSEEEDKVVSCPISSPPSSDRLITPAQLSRPFAFPPSASSSSLQDDHSRLKHERAGGLEDWEDVNGADVDRYGFISIRRPNSIAETLLKNQSHPSPGRRNLLIRRPDSSYSNAARSLMRSPNRKISARSLNTYTSEFSTISRLSAPSSARAAANLLPHNRDRKWMDEASEMLTLQPGLTDIAEDELTVKIAESLKRKEWERSAKWRKMAKIVKRGGEGHGMEFEFDCKNPKLIERTWKGIPDCWRAAAWSSFLSSSAKAWGYMETDEKLIGEFLRLQELASPDDVQIDLDVPRTINRHIMFRRRYRGGQRLLFRVLHAISLYFPDTGYVQGMASLAATLLCYYDEEKCFVMLVRMWKYRGLSRLYGPGFAGLMDVLREFEDVWLGSKDVANKLSELSIDATAYGTRWYLTLFNLSIPFPAQLRVWDVFMLLGDTPPPETLDPKIGEAAVQEVSMAAQRSMDVLHATSAALIHALREVLLDSDFENAMKALTSWIPIKDEELLMKVAHAEWKQHSVRKKKV